MTFGNYYFAGGPASLIVIVLTLFALVFTGVAMVLAFVTRGAVAPAISAVVLLLLAFGIVVIGVGAGLFGRARMNRALVNVDSEYREQIRAEGEREANQPLMMGILGGALPGMAAVALGILAAKRRTT